MASIDDTTPLGAKLQRLLLRPSAAFVIPLLAVLLCSSAVGPHYVLDDFVLGLAARGELDGRSHGGWDLFRFTTGERALNHELMTQGLLLPWWSDEHLKIAFYRPLSSLLHRLDYALWPDSARGMYVHSLVWLALVMGLVACLYRRLEGSRWIAGLAALLYAIDDAPGAVVAWLSNRNALIATAFGLVTLLAHHHWRRYGQRAAAWLAPACLLLALSAGEFAAGALAYLVSYTLFLDRARLRERMLALVPHAAVLAAWGVIYLRSGAGVAGSGSYVSPWADFARFLSIAPARIASLLAATLGPIPAELLLLGGRAHLAYGVALAGLVLAGAAYAFWPILRRDRTARFWLCGTVLAVIPVSASFPSDRLTLFANVGGMGLLARLVSTLLVPAPLQTLGVARATLGAAFAFAHLVLAPLALPLRAAQMQLIGRALEVGTTCFDRIPELEQRTVVIVNAPLDVLASYIQAERAWRHLPRPKHLYWLTTAGSSGVVTRIGPSTLLVERAAGFLSTPLERHYRDPPDTLAPGHEVRLGPMLATVLSLTGDGRPLAVSFRFAEPLESPSYAFLLWKDGRYRPLALSRLAQPLQFPAEDLGKILIDTALGAP